MDQLKIIIKGIIEIMAKGKRKSIIYLSVLTCCFLSFLLSLCFGAEPLSVFSSFTTAITTITVTYFGANSLENFKDSSVKQALEQKDKQ